jgi:hypothetical protein
MTESPHWADLAAVALAGATFLAGLAFSIWKFCAWLIHHGHVAHLFDVALVSHPHHCLHLRFALHPETHVEFIAFRSEGQGRPQIVNRDDYGRSSGTCPFNVVVQEPLWIAISQSVCP